MALRIGPGDEFETTSSLGSENGEAGKNEFMMSWQEWLKASIWVALTVISVLSGKSLLVDHSYLRLPWVGTSNILLYFDYPNDILAWTLSLLYALALLVIYILRLQKLVHPELPAMELDLYAFRKPNWWSNRRSFLQWAVKMSAAASCALSLPLLMQGLLHMPSPPVFMMLSPLVHVVDSIAFYCLTTTDNYTRGIRSSQKIAWETCVVALLSLAVLYDEYRLTVNGLLFCGFGVVSVGIFRACFIVSSDSAVPHEAGRVGSTLDRSFITVAPAVGLVTTGVCSILVEGSEPLTTQKDPATVILIAINVASTVGVIVLGTSLLTFSPVLAGDSSICCGIPLPSHEVLPPVVASLVVFTVATHSGTVYVSFTQIAAYLLASISLLGFARLQQAYEHLIDRGLRCCATPSRSGEIAGARYGSKRKGVVAACFFLVLLMPFTWFLYRGTTSALESIDHSTTPHLDLHFEPKHRFDIVISMFDEDPRDVGRMLSAVKATGHISTLPLRVIIYSKHPDPDEALLRSATGASVVEKLENRGREGGTFLHHILHRWDDLAEQTMFIQAHVHNMREFIPRLNNYLRPNTGMLSLGFAGVLCDCNRCSDRWGWSDDWDLVSTTYQQIYNHTCSRALLAYKGQFVASARRIRGTPQDLYKKLYDGVTSPRGGWTHDEAIVKGRPDSPSAPFFGYTVERLWSILMQCSEPGIAVKCPSLLSKWRTGGGIEDCQCLDTV
ncbi:MAG: hypothetical protein M1813_007325 [Trichoglossum hirsutum]|nr:MAG: hypothetical protein M1813_007325 [Trichoglossum hirsutum]